MKLLKFYYKCSGGNGDYYEGEIEAKSENAAKLNLILKYHSVLSMSSSKQQTSESK